MKIRFGKKTWKFISNFSKFNLSTIKVYMKTHHNIDLLIKDFNDKLLKVQSIVPQDVISEDLLKQSKETGIPNENYEGELYFLDAQLEEIQNNIRKERTTLLVSLCLNNKSKFIKFLENTNGVTYGLIKEALKALHDKLGNFTDYWTGCPEIDEFSFRKPWHVFKTKYMIHSMEKTTLLRDNLANYQIKAAFSYQDKLINEKSWDDICMFVSIITRPKKQEFEFSFNSSAFINSKELVGLDHSDRLKYYTEKLQESWERRSKYFNKLPLNIAIGILKSYWKKKTNLN